MSCASAYPTPSTLFDKTAGWFERASAALLGDLPCRRGCFRCCIGLFPVTLLDRREIQRGLHSLPPDRREAMVRKATQQAVVIAAAAPSLVQSPFIDDWQDRDIDDLTARFATLPCPALDEDGGCSLYQYRPLVCRSMGIPSDDGQVVQGACEVQTALPLIRLSKSLRREEELLAEAEAQQLAALRRRTGAEGEELFLPFAFLAETGGIQREEGDLDRT